MLRLCDLTTSNMAEEKKRFAELSDLDLKKLLADKDSANTQKSTKVAVNAFRNYLHEKGLDEVFEEYDVPLMNQTLARYYVEVRTSNGELYKKSSLYTLRHGLNRYIESKRSVNIIKDGEFKESCNMFQAAVKELKREGKGGVDHYPPIDGADLAKMYQHFELNDPVKLQQKVFVDICLYFGRRGRENIRDLKIKDFVLTHDDTGNRYIYLAKDELTKNHQEDPNTAKGRMYARPDDDRCPVKSFILYHRHLNPKCTFLFQRPKTSTVEGSKVWYDASPLGHNCIGDFLPDISAAAGLSIRYTNHSLRSTTVSILDGIFSDRHIITVTGHKSESSLKTYAKNTPAATKRKMSSVISESLSGPKRAPLVPIQSAENVPSAPLVPIQSAENVPSVSELSTSFELLPLTNSQENNIMSDIFDDDLDDIYRQINVSNKIVSKPQAQNPRNNIPAPTFNNCSNITINFNFGK